MIGIKVECGCGQRYAFDVEPVDGQMPHTVACPVCGIDGTAAANAAIAQSAPPRPVRVAIARPPAGASTAQPPAEASRLQVATTAAAPPSTAPRRPTRVPGQLDPTQAEHEARAKIFWGDDPKDVLKFLLVQGFSREEASEVIQRITSERAVTIRKIGIGKIVSGIVMVCVPIVALITFLSIGFILIKTFAITVAIGLWGVYRIIRGTVMIMAPRMRWGDIADQ